MSGLYPVRLQLLLLLSALTLVRCLCKGLLHFPPPPPASDLVRTLDLCGKISTFLHSENVSAQLVPDTTGHAVGLLSSVIKKLPLQRSVSYLLFLTPL